MNNESSPDTKAGKIVYKINLFLRGRKFFSACLIFPEHFIVSQRKVNIDSNWENCVNIWKQSFFEEISFISFSRATS